MVLGWNLRDFSAVETDINLSLYAKEWKENQYKSGGISDHMMFLFVHLFLSEQSVEALPVSKIV